MELSEQDKSNFLWQHRLRGVVVFILTYSVFFFVILPLTKVIFIFLSREQDFNFLNFYKNLYWINQLAIVLSISTVTALLLPVINKLRRSFYYFSGLHGFYIGIFLSILVSFRTDLFLLLNLPYLAAYLMFSLITIPSIYFLFIKVFSVVESKKNIKIVDKLNYSDLISQMKNYISNESCSYENKICILYGRNGQGKTHSLKLLEGALIKKYNVNYFYPSRYSSEVMPEEFYSFLEKLLTRKYYLPNLSFYSKTFANLINIVEQKTRASGFFSSVLINLLFGERRDISDVLIFYQSQLQDIVLLVDETDRCSIEQIETFVGIIRNLGTNIGIKIIITFTHEIELEYRGKYNKHSTESIFEKVAKRYYQLPARTLEQTKTYWNNICVNNDMCDLSFLSEQFTYFISAILSTPRLLQIFKNHYQDFYMNYPLFRNIDNSVILFVFALKSISPNYFSSLAEGYHVARYTSTVPSPEELTIFLRKSVNFDTLDKSILFKGDFSYISRTIYKTQQTYYLEYIFLNLKPYENFTSDKVSDYLKYLEDFDSISNKISDQENREAFTLTIADALSQAFEKKKHEVMLILTHCIENNKKNLFYLIFNKFSREHKMFFFQELAKNTNCFHFYNALWLTGNEYDFNKTSTFSELLTSIQLLQIIENLYTHDKWYGIKNLLAHIKKNESLHRDILKNYSANQPDLYHLCKFLENQPTLANGSSTQDLSSIYSKLTDLFKHNYRYSTDSKEIIKTLSIVFAQSYSEIHDVYKHKTITEEFYNTNINNSCMFNYFLVNIISYFYEHIILLDAGVTLISEYYATLFKKIKFNNKEDSWCAETLKTYNKLQIYFDTKNLPKKETFTILQTISPEDNKISE